MSGYSLAFASWAISHIDQEGEPCMGEQQDRERRKHEHIAAVKALADHGSSGFDDVMLLPASASEMDVEDVRLDSELLGFKLSSPIVVNAMTGGTDEAREINGRLAAFSARHGLAMALGSETAALKDPEVAESYTVARALNPHGLLIANVGMGADLKAAQMAVDLVDADLLQVHWNTAQELFMAEGDRHFTGMLEKLKEVSSGLSVPTIAKEVGQGMTGPAAQNFVDCGVRGVDIGGVGGTNFIAIEAWRRGLEVDREWQSWGIPTASSLGEVYDTVGSQVHVIASGGIRSGHDVAKALAMGATAVGVAGSLMRLVTQDNPDERLDEWLASVKWTLTMIMVLTGARTVSELRECPVLISGRTQNWLYSRGHDDYCRQLATRGPRGE